MKNKIRVTIGANSYVVVGEENDEHIKKVVDLVDEDFNLISKSHPSFSTTDRTMLTAINIADSYIKSEQKYISIIEDFKISEQELKLKADSLINEVIDLKNELEKVNKIIGEIEGIDTGHKAYDSQESDSDLEFNSSNYPLDEDEELIIIKATNIDKTNSDEKYILNNIDENNTDKDNIDENNLDEDEEVANQTKFDFRGLNRGYNDYFKSKTRITFDDEKDENFDD